MSSSNHSYSVLILFSLLLPFILNSSPLTSSCPTKCGKLDFPYPFGLREECYLDKGYEVQCRNNSGRNVPFLSANNIEIERISLPSENNTIGLIVLKSPAMTTNIEGFGSLWNLTGLKDKQWFKEKPYALLELEWFFRTRNLSDHDIPYHGNCICQNTTDAGVMYASCECKKGFKGNPFLLGGCTDIDECKMTDNEGNKLYCRQGEQCMNLVGTYLCIHKYKFSIGDLNIYGILLIVGSCLLVFVGVGVLYIFIRRHIRIKRQKKFFKSNGGLLLQQQLTTTHGNVESTRVFSSKELAKATGIFSESRVLGKGGQGVVYKGMLIDGKIIAVKKSTVIDQDKIEEFINEVVILSQLSHRNIVKLLGCCLETQVPLLVYEFISNGNLFEHLHEESADQTMMTWEVRLRIAIEIAEALSYLHSTASIPIYPRDVKTTNIMLDDKYRAKVSDFGTRGYVDPEYHQSNQYTDKSDVYSYGVVLVELITGEKPISSARPPQHVTLASYFVNHIIKEDKVVDTIDPRIKNNCKVEQVMAVAHVARRCLSLKKRKRPNMRQVSMELKMIRSSPEETQPHVCLSDDEEGNLEAYLGVDLSNDVAVTAPMSTSQHNVASSSRWSDTEPLFPLWTQ